MFKKPLHKLKPSTPLRSSDRRKLIAELRSAFAAFPDPPPGPAVPITAPSESGAEEATGEREGKSEEEEQKSRQLVEQQQEQQGQREAELELVNRLVPEGIRKGDGLTHVDDKVTIYSDDAGRPLWFRTGKGKEEVIVPTVYALWIHPPLLPAVPVWSPVLPHLYSGSALMVPGLSVLSLPSPPFPLPRGSVVAVVSHGSRVPLVVGQLEMSTDELLSKRRKGEKGKAVKVLHCWKDEVWKMGGKGEPPVLEPVEGQVEVEGEYAPVDVEDEGAEAEAQPFSQRKGGTEGTEDTPPQPVQAAEAEEINEEHEEQNTPELTTTEVDLILLLSLLYSISQTLGADPSLLPMPASSLYSAHILPSRPTTLPPHPAKPKKTNANTNAPSAPPPASSRSNGWNWQEEWAGRPKTDVKPSEADVKKSSYKKVAKWVKAMEKRGLLKAKEVRGELMIMEVDAKHPDVVSFVPYRTFTSHPPGSTTGSLSSTMMGTVAAEGNGSGSAAATRCASTSGVGTGGGEGTVVKQDIVVEKFLVPHGQTVKFFQQMGESASAQYTPSQVRELLLSYVDKEQLVCPADKSRIRYDPLLYRVLVRKNEPEPQGEDARSVKRDLAVQSLQRGMGEAHRIVVRRHRQAGGGAGAGTTVVEEEKGEIRKGPAQAIKVEVKQRQGRKLVTLVTGLETWGVEPKELADELRVKVGASATVTPLAKSTPKHPQSELLVQGDQRKALVDSLAARGLDRRYIDGLAAGPSKGKK